MRAASALLEHKTPEKPFTKFEKFLSADMSLIWLFTLKTFGILPKTKSCVLQFLHS